MGMERKYDSFCLMRTATNTFIIESKLITNDSTGIFIGDKELKLDTDFNRHKHAVRTGKIHTLPLKISKDYINDTPLNEGDNVVIHHFVIQPENKRAENLYLCKYLQVYAIIKDNTLIPIEDLIFVEPTEETEEDTTNKGFISKTEKGNVKQKGKVFASSKKAQQSGISAGDIIYFTRNGDYKINLVGQDLYRMKIRNVVAIEKNGELECFNGKILVENCITDKVERMYISPKFGSSIKAQVIKIDKNISSVLVGDVINYAHALGNETITHKGKKYEFVQESNINYIVNES